jgi:UDP-N-acetylglucosamine 2-epimerase (non-hydrolysing)
MKRITVIFGTRPEAIKLAPVIGALKQREGIETCVVLTAQHRDLVDPVLDFFGIVPDHDLDIMAAAQSPSDVTVRVLASLQELFSNQPSDCVIVQGDTTSAMAAAMAAFYRKIPVVHVEAGLRTPDRYNPFPEEMNRRLTSQLTTLHCAATESNRENLLRENIAPESIIVTGNPVIDALMQITSRNEPLPPALAEIDTTKRIILLTTHRRENFGQPQQNIFEAVNTIIEKHDDVEVVFPVHPNPAVKEAVERHLKKHPRIRLIEPLDYIAFVRLMAMSYFIMSDSGGLQEEAPALGRPILVLRTTTEREEVIRAGNARLVGVDRDTIINNAEELLTQQDVYERMSQPSFPFGSGGAAERIVGVVLSGELFPVAAGL